MKRVRAALRALWLACRIARARAEVRRCVLCGEPITFEKLPVCACCIAERGP